MAMAKSANTTVTDIAIVNDDMVLQEDAAENQVMFAAADAGGAPMAEAEYAAEKAGTGCRNNRR